MQIRVDMPRRGWLCPLCHGAHSPDLTTCGGGSAPPLPPPPVPGASPVPPSVEWLRWPDGSGAMPAPRGPLGNREKADEAFYPLRRNADGSLGLDGTSLRLRFPPGGGGVAC